jgi:hypothetical protein
MIMNNKGTFKEKERIQKLLEYISTAEEIIKQCREELLEYAKVYKLSIDFQKNEVTDWGELGGERNE